MEQHILTPGDYVAILKRRRWALLLPFIAVVVITAVVALALPSIYKSTATILIEEQEIPSDFVMTTVTSFVEQRLQTINQRIMSTPKLLEIINKNKLYQDLRDRKTTDEIVAQMRADVVLKPISTEVIDRRTGRPTTATIAFSLSYEGQSPTKVQRVANVLTSLFMEENLKERRKKSQDAIIFLHREAQRIKADLGRVEKEMATFKEANMNALPDVLQVNLQTIDTLERNIDIFNERLRAQKERESYLIAQLSGLDPAKEDREQLQDRQRLEELKLKLIEYRSRYTDVYPDVRKTVAEIAKLESKLDAMKTGGDDKAPDNPTYVTLSSQLAGTQAEIGSIKRQIADLNKKAQRFRNRIEATPKVEETYKSILMRRDNLKLKYDDLMRKLMEAQVAQGLESDQKGERFTLIDPARLPEKPYKPNRLAIMLIGLVLGCGAGVGFAALRELSDTSIRSAEQLAAATALPVLAGIPQILTVRDLKRKKTKRLVGATVGVVIVLGAVLVFHFWVMDLTVLGAKLERKMAF